jgi:hypothetical protein
MRTNPFSDALDFLTEGEWTSYVFALLLLGSVVIAAVNLWRDANQRSVLHLWNWLARFFIGALWWQQSLWKLPPTYTDNPAEWPWTYFFLIVVQIMLLVQRPGRSLGLDAILLRREQQSAEHGLWDRLVRVLS